MFILRLVFASIMWVTIFPAYAQGGDQAGKNPILTVVGRGSYDVKPDIAFFQAEVSVEEKTADEAAKAHEEKVTRAVGFLKLLSEHGLEIEKSTFTLRERRVQIAPNTAGNSGPKPLSIVEGYVASSIFSIKLSNLENLNQVVANIAGTGFFEIEKISFKVLQERTALNQARRAAMLDALDQARAYVDPVGLKLEQILIITDGEATPPDGYADLPFRSRSGSYSVQIIPPTKLEFSASVNVTWRIRAAQKVR